MPVSLPEELKRYIGLPLSYHLKVQSEDGSPLLELNQEQFNAPKAEIELLFKTAGKISCPQNTAAELSLPASDFCVYIGRHYDLKPGIKVHCAYCGKELKLYDHHIKLIKEPISTSEQLTVKMPENYRRLYCSLPRYYEELAEEPGSRCPEMVRRGCHAVMTCMLLPYEYLPFFEYPAKIVDAVIRHLKHELPDREQQRLKQSGIWWSVLDSAHSRKSAACALGM